MSHYTATLTYTKRTDSYCRVITLCTGVSWTIRITSGPGTKATTEILWLYVLDTRLWRHFSVCVCFCVYAFNKISAMSKNCGCGDLLANPTNAKIKQLQPMWRSMSYSCYSGCKIGIWIEVTRCAWQWSCILLLLNMVKVGGLYMQLAWVVRDSLRCSSDLSILIALSIKQIEQLGDSGRAQYC